MNEIIREKVKNLPRSSGVYIMKNDKGEIIYVGKAKVLKNRVSQYFQNSQKQIKVQTMVDNIADFEYVMTPTELDAFILENTLIKKHKPFFNILLKDGKQYPYIKVNPHEDFPKFSVVRKVKRDGARYFGPYFGKLNAYELLETIRTAFPLRNCNKSFSMKKQTRPCLNNSLGLCSAPCCGLISKEDYKILVGKAMQFLNGNEKEIKEILKEKMEKASESENFELAITLRNRIAMINELSNKTIVDLAKNEEIDLFCIESDGNFAALNTTIIRTGKILSSQNTNFTQGLPSLEESLASYILQYYSNKLVPKTILTNIPLDFELVSNALSLLKGSNVEVAIPQKGIKKKLVDMSLKNANNTLQKEISKGGDEIFLEMVKELKLALGLEKLPNRMECYDISHISGTNKVGSMVVFSFGKPLKSDYRKFKIKTVEGNDDFACLQEVLRRRNDEFNKKKDLSFKKEPDLLVIDGGKGQLSSVVEELEKTTFKNVPIISLAKRFEEVYTPYSKIPIRLPEGSLSLRLLQNIRDEAHRFAITFHRSLRSKKMIEED